MKEEKIKELIKEVWDCKKKGYNINIFSDGTYYCYVGNNNNDNSIKTYKHKNISYDGFFSNFPKTKKEITKEINILFQVR